MWVLILMISLLAPLNDRKRMLAIAGTFVLMRGRRLFRVHARGPATTLLGRYRFVGT